MHAAPSFQPLGSVARLELGTRDPEVFSPCSVAIAVAKREAQTSEETIRMSGLVDPTQQQTKRQQKLRQRIRFVGTEQEVKFS